ncbi:hypothetical protein P3T37_003150 [Kitasatospora sp. MAA4]|uniref:hypothetical protein n=1 Tax=Kitasatospora sp. MAA4 TaxID=3035093 RepID=UPI0024752D50|nr:hypothetical protein [Kitasatospora sp. MAA4]MDH6133752.1 hypothetical protein [Kitasatospora sp. MAA4]
MAETTPASSGTAPGGGSIAGQLDHLIRTGHPDGKGPTDYHAIARASHAYAAAHGGPTISHQAVLNIRKGTVTNVGVNALQALANVYGVPVTYFFEHGPDSLLAAKPQPAAASSTEVGTPHGEVVVGRLMTLLSAVQPRGQAPSSDEELAEAIRSRGGRITLSCIAALRADRWGEGMRERLREFAVASGVPADYFFFDDKAAALVAEDLALLSVFKEVGARKVAMRRVAELDDEGIRALNPVLELLSSVVKRKRK